MYLICVAEGIFAMSLDVIRQCAQLPNPVSFYFGLELPENFVLPDNILMFSHSWHPGRSQDYTTNRHRLEIPAVPLVYEIGESEQYDVTPGHAIFIKGCQKWRIQKTDPDLLNGYLRLIITFELKDEQQFYLPDNEVCKLTEEGEKILEKLYSSFIEKSAASCSAALFQLLQSLSENQLQALPRSMSVAVRKAVYYINRIPCRDVTLAEIASFTHTSVSTLRRLFKRDIGMSIGVFCLEHKMKVARHSLIETTLSLEEIAGLCGFKSVYSFSHFFSRNEGVSPGRYRQVNKKTE